MRRLAGLLAVLACLWFLPAPAGAADVTLRFGSINAVNTSSFDDILVPYARLLEEKSGNRIAVDLKPLGGFGKPVELFPMVESGKIEICATVQGYHPGRFPRSSVMELPGIYQSAETGTDVMMSLLEQGLLEKEYDSVKVLALYVLPPYGIFADADHKIETLRDLRGLRLRAPSTTVGLAMARLGAIPIGLPINLIGSTLNDKLIDGMAYGWDSAFTTVAFADKTLAQQVKYMFDMNFAAPALMIVMNRKVYEGLPEDLRKLVDSESGRKLAKLSATVRDRQEAVAKQRLAASPQHVVVKLTDADRKEMQQRIAPVFDDWAAGMKRQGIDGGAILSRARALGSNS